MKKIIIYTSVIGVAIGFVTYFVKKMSSNKDPKHQTSDNEIEVFDTSTTKNEQECKIDIVEEMEDTKRSSAHSIHDRHLEAVDIMRNSFESIYKDMEPLEQAEEIVDNIVVETETNKIDLASLSDELDDLLK